jgi:hypothetical protein
MLTRRTALSLLAALPLAAPKAWAQARLSYDLKPIMLADGVWMIARPTISRCRMAARL